MNYRRLSQKHSYYINHITNPKKSGGGTKTEKVPFVSGWYLSELREVGEAEIVFPNTYLNAQGKRFHPRTIDKFDIIEVWRDLEIVFSGEVVGMDMTFSSLKIKCFSQVWLLTQQHTAVESHTEEPSTTVARFLKGYCFKRYDDFSTDVITSGDWVTDGTWQVLNGKLDWTGGAAKYVEYNTALTAAEWTDAIVEFDFSPVAFGVAYGLELWPAYSADDDGEIQIQILTANQLNISMIDYAGSPTAYTGLIGYTAGTTYRICLKLENNGSGCTWKLFFDNVKLLELTGNTAFRAGKLRINGKLGNGTSHLTLDNFSTRVLYQCISEGALSTYGSSITTSVSRETLLNAIDKRVCSQCTSSDDLASHWEWKENPVAYTDTTTPCASLDFTNRVGSNKDISLKVDEKNISSARISFDFENFKNELIALGAGTTDITGTGQKEYTATDIDAYNEVGILMQKLYQFSEETDYATLVQLATLNLGKYTRIHENLQVDPVDYEKKGFGVGDGYKIDIPELMTDTTTYYRIISERREFTPTGGEKITINWKERKRLLSRMLDEILRGNLNKARYDQGRYITLNYSREAESVGSSGTTANNTLVQVSDDSFYGVKRCLWNFEISGYKYYIYIDGTNRTSEIIGIGTGTANAFNQDITRYVSETGTNHAIVMTNAGSAQYLAAFGFIEVYTK